MTETAPMTGGCQCGAVRYRLAKPPTGVGICFCRMCQKSVGNYFAAHAGVSQGDLTWTRGEPAVFRSSEAAERGYCRDCGTPLTYVLRGSGRISVTAGSLDDPGAFPPDRAFGWEGRTPWFDTLCRLGGSRTEDEIPPAELPRFRSWQHPDEDT